MRSTPFHESSLEVDLRLLTSCESLPPVLPQQSSKPTLQLMQARTFLRSHITRTDRLSQRRPRRRLSSARCHHRPLAASVPKALEPSASP